jgi:hypothetical protein
LKNAVEYKSDPPGVELLQTLPTLLTNNYWGKPGLGDCDCFTIAFTSCCIVKNIPVKIVLCGHKKGEYSHIYNLAEMNKAWFEADLTQPAFGSARKYRDYKILTVNG